jgi:cyclopropane fatty-acyl-phospholipid synthase-like methyltransferase/methyltransferase-like protein
MSGSGDPSSYDLVPYASFAFQDSHPFRLAAIGALYGMNCPAAEHARVLELGCGSGGNLIPMAEQLPGARFVGIDYSRKEVETALQAARELGLPNISFEVRDIGNFEVEAGGFDYIIAHGVYSWVPEEIRARMLEICALGLAEQGVAYVSYNTYPGWRLQEVTREMMLFHGRDVRDPAERLRRGREIVEVMARLRPGQEAYAALMREEQQRLSKNIDSHVLHDDLEQVNSPVYFYEFHSRVKEKGLKYLGDSRFSEMRLETLPAAVATELKRLGAERVELEQHLDFVRGNTFRRSVLCRMDAKVLDDISVEKLDSLCFASDVKMPDRVDLTSRDGAAFETLRGTLTVTEPVLKAAMTELKRAWPKSLKLAELWERSREFADERGSAENRASFSRWMLGNILFGIVEYWAGEWNFVTEVSQKPVASGVARRQAIQSYGGIRGVTNRRHEMIQVDEVSARLLWEMNGENDQEVLTMKLMEIAHRGEIVVRDGQRAILDRAEMERFLRSSMKGALEMFGKKALLVG